jgi:hypothetical protein
MARKNAFYAQSGGVTAVINASACGVLETARQHSNAALWDRCLVMAPIPRKPSKRGQFKSPNLSTRRGALHDALQTARDVTEPP